MKIDESRKIPDGMELKKKKAAEHESNCDICSWCPWNHLQCPVKETGRSGDQMKIPYHLNHRTVSHIAPLDKQRRTRRYIKR